MLFEHDAELQVRRSVRGIGVGRSAEQGLGLLQIGLIRIEYLASLQRQPMRLGPVAALWQCPVQADLGLRSAADEHYRHCGEYEAWT